MSRRFVPATSRPMTRSARHRHLRPARAALYRALLPRCHGIANHTDHFEEIWRDEDQVLDESERAIADGAIAIEETPALDLAVALIPRISDKDP